MDLLTRLQAFLRIPSTYDVCSRIFILKHTYSVSLLSHTTHTHKSSFKRSLLTTDVYISFIEWGFPHSKMLGKYLDYYVKLNTGQVIVCVYLCVQNVHSLDCPWERYLNKIGLLFFFGKSRFPIMNSRS
jgi:hypothetical protein